MALVNVPVLRVASATRLRPMARIASTLGLDLWIGRNPARRNGPGVA
jgi:hypothetical protein